MTARAKTLLAVSLIALPCLALAHNGRDVGKLPKLSAAPARAAAPGTQAGDFIVDIFDGIAISVDPRTGVRTYTQIGDIPSNPARAKSSVPVSGDAAVRYWVDKSFQARPAGYEAPPQESAPAPQLAMYDEGYADYGYGYGYGGGYLGGYYGGGGGGRGHGRPGGGDGRPGGGDNNPPPVPPGGYRLQPGSGFSPPPGPYGGGVGSPPPYDDRGVGAPPPALRYGGFRSRRG